MPWGESKATVAVRGMRRGGRKRGGEGEREVRAGGERCGPENTEEGGGSIYEKYWVNVYNEKR